MATSSRRVAAVAMVWLVAVVVAAAGVVAAASSSESETTTDGPGPKLGCFCDCMKNRCMTLGGAADKFACATACNQACIQISQPGQTKDDDFCGF